MGISSQFRVLGGSLGVAVCANILNNHPCHLTDQVAEFVDSVHVQGPKGAASLCPGSSVNSAGTAGGGTGGPLAASFGQQMQVVLGLSAAGLVSTLLMVEKRPRFQH
jgi:hypothetical protein